jgi:hypothetical protein
LVKFGPSLSEHDYRYLDLGAAVVLCREALDHRVDGTVQGVNLSVRAHAAADIGKHNHRQRTCRRNSEILELRHASFSLCQ